MCVCVFLQNLISVYSFCENIEESDNVSFDIRRFIKNFYNQLKLSIC